jgi:hypothetical protein
VWAPYEALLIRPSRPSSFPSPTASRTQSSVPVRLSAGCVVETGDTDEADRYVAIMERLARALGQPELR